MISIVVITVLATFALLTKVGVVAFERTYPPQGRPIEVAGAALNVVELGPNDSPSPPVVMIHGASSNLEAMRQPLGELLAHNHRVILIDRPGHGWSVRERAEDSTPEIQCRMIAEALGKLGVGPVILVVHSWSGALGARMALDFPQLLAGLVMLAPVTHPWRGGVGWYNKAVATPVIGPLLAYTITLPLGLTLKAAVAAQAPRYGEISVPTTVISGEVDKTVSTNIHSRPFTAAVPNSKLIVLPGVGHMVQNAAPDLVAAEIDAMMSGVGQRVPAAGTAH